MSIENIKNLIPEYAKDLKLNISNVLAQPELSEVQIWGVAYSTALATKNSLLIQHIREEAQERLTPEALNAAQIASALMAMNNVYYKFPYMVGKEKYSTMPANLRMTGIRNHGHNQLDFELFSLAVSVINGCVFCVKAHEKLLIEGGFSEDKILASIRIAAVMSGVASVI